MNKITNEIIENCLTKFEKDNLEKIYYKEIFFEELIKSNDNLISLSDEVSEFLIESNICSKKKDVIVFLENLIKKIQNYGKVIYSDDSDEENKEEEEEEEIIKDGSCELCYCQESVTLHHAIPKLMIKR